MKNKLVLVADLALLKAFKLDRTELNQSLRLELVEEIELAAAHQKLADRLTDQAGRFASAAKHGASSGERHNIALEHRKRLVKLLAERVAALLRSPAVNACYFAASREINHKILEILPTDVRSKIVKNIPADLTKLEKAELLARFTAGQ